MSDGLKALMQRHAEELEHEQKAHRDALALCEVYEQRIAELQSQLDAARAGQWTPVENGMYYTDGPEVVEVADERIIVYQGAQGAWANLQRGFALCKLQPFGVSPRTEAGRWVVSGGETPKPASDGSGQAETLPVRIS